MESKEVNDGEKQDGCRRSTRLVEKLKKANGGDERHGGDGRCKNGQKGGDRS